MTRPSPPVTLDHQLRVPGSKAYLLLPFSSPSLQTIDAMAELFNAVASSLTWTDGGYSHE
jgi:hypothetical protein